jgi:hypothetical protein
MGAGQTKLGKKDLEELEKLSTCMRCFLLPAFYACFTAVSGDTILVFLLLFP